MIHRALAGLAVAACLVACGTETTSVGGPRGSQASASSDDDASPDAWTPPVYSGKDGGGPGGWPCAYTWMPVPGTGPCEYIMPTERQNESRDLDSATWDPRNVRVDLWTATPVDDAGVQQMLSSAIGGYKETPATCGTDHGWYYVSSGNEGRPTSYALCPTSCGFLDNDGAQIRLTAFGWCGSPSIE
ncbi:MAG: hypothetical protein KF764_33505 [Labilithrix sp.]|nr:hypothetical protein [Labilithrix sp.]MBX3224587.1 hypothetical protein [Labilithrix sp.]